MLNELVYRMDIMEFEKIQTDQGSDSGGIIWPLILI